MIRRGVMAAGSRKRTGTLLETEGTKAEVS